MSEMRKILLSPGYGAGWVSWAENIESKRLMIDWPPLVSAVEAGEKVSNDHPAVKSLHKLMKQRGLDVPYGGGLCDLLVVEVCGRVRIEEYDGSESYEDEGYFDEWL